MGNDGRVGRHINVAVSSFSGMDLRNGHSISITLMRRRYKKIKPNTYYLYNVLPRQLMIRITRYLPQCRQTVLRPMTPITILLQPLTDLVCAVVRPLLTLHDLSSFLQYCHFNQTIAVVLVRKIRVVSVQQNQMISSERCRI
jgi:hypothetical protein